MAGGFSGTVPVASEADTEAAELALEATLTEALTADLTQNLPDGYLIVDNSTTYSFETLPNTEGPDGTVVITVSGEAQGVAIDSRAMAREAATNRIQGYTGEPVAFVDPSTISVSLVDTAIDIGSATSTSLRASGASTLVWTFDIEELKEKIAGIKRSATRDIFSGYPGIERADVVVRPFWKRSLPKTIEDIEIRVESATN